MQIRYLEAMQAMAKSANSKVIFLPGGPSAMSVANSAGEGPSNYDTGDKNTVGMDMGDGFQRAMNARQVENI